jgi:hypothetical protein
MENRGFVIKVNGLLWGVDEDTLLYIQENLDESVVDKDSFLKFLEQTVTSGLYEDTLKYSSLEIFEKPAEFLIALVTMLNCRADQGSSLKQSVDTLIDVLSCGCAVDKTEVERLYKLSKTVLEQDDE